MTLKGYHFDRETVTPLADAKLYSFLANGYNGILANVGNGLPVTTSGLIATIGTGAALINGRLIEVTSAHNVSIPASSNGYIVLTVDLSQANTSTGDVGTDSYTVINNQVRAEFITNLTMNDLNNGGTLFTLNLGRITSTATTATYTKNSDAYYKGIIAPDGIVFGNSVTDFESGIDQNRWYGAAGQDLIIDVPTGRKLIIRNKDNPAQQITIDTATGTIGQVLEVVNTGTFGGNFTSDSVLRYKRIGNVVNAIFNGTASKALSGNINMGYGYLPTWAGSYDDIPYYMTGNDLNGYFYAMSTRGTELYARTTLQSGINLRTYAAWIVS